MKTLRPIVDFDSYSKGIEKAIYSFLYQRIFSPLLDILNPPKQLENASTTALLKALKEGKIRYVAPYFHGDLNIAISKELKGAGAIYNKTKKSFKLEPSLLPLYLKVAITEASQIGKEKAKKMLSALDKAQKEKIENINFEVLFADTISKLEKQLNATTKPLTAKDIEIPFDPSLKDKLKEAYTENLNIYVKKWNDEQILKLREAVEENATQGFRAESLTTVIQQQKNITANKAKFLARNETSLLVSKYKEIRYTDIGITHYKWSATMDKRTRDLHRKLNGKIFRFDEPPVIDSNTLQRGNPGCTYNCRCVSIPILPSRAILQGEKVNV